MSHSRSLRAPTPATPPPPPRRTRAWREGLRSLTPPSSRAQRPEGPQRTFPDQLHPWVDPGPGYGHSSSHVPGPNAPHRRTSWAEAPLHTAAGRRPQLALGRRSSGFPHSPQGLGSRRLPPHPSLRLGSRLQKIDKAVNRGAAGGKCLLGTRRYPFRANPSRSPARGPRGGPRLVDSNTGNRGRALHSPRCFRQPHGG